MLKHERDINWPDSAKTTEQGKYPAARTITVVWQSNLMRDGGSYAVWQGEELVKDGLGLDRAKRLALSTQGENGRPIEEAVDRI